MLPNPAKFCSRCENEVTVGGYCLVPGRDDIPWYCLKCAIEFMKEQSQTEIKHVNIIRPRGPEEEGTNGDKAEEDF